LLLQQCNNWDESVLSWTNAARCFFQKRQQTSKYFLGKFDEKIDGSMSMSPNTWNEVPLDFTFDAVDTDGNSIPNFITLRITSHRANGVTYASKENANARGPKLVIDYYIEGNANAEAEIQADDIETVETVEPSKSPTAPIQNGVYDAVVIGAGWAGIRAVKTLINRGIKKDKILVLEANDYIGGRSKSINTDGTINSPNPTGKVPFDVGSEWLYNTGSAMEETLLDRGFLKSEMLDNDRYTAIPLEIGQFYQQTRNANTGEITTEIMDDADALIEDVWGGFLQFREDGLDDELEGKSYAEAIDAYIEESNITDSEELQLLNLIEDVSEIEYTGDSSKLALDEIEFFPPDYTIATHYMAVPNMGFGNIAAEYADSFSELIKLDAKVTDVNYQGENSVVKYLDKTNGKIERVRAKTILVTASLGVLKAGSINFIPSLPSWKQDSIDNMGFGLVNKCIMLWNNAEDLVWPEDQLWFMLATPDDQSSGTWTTFHNPSVYKGGPTLTAYAGGNEAWSAEEQTDEDIVDDVMKNLFAMFPIIRRPDTVIISRWGQEETIRGTYSFPVPGRDFYRDAEKLKQTVAEKVWFAGEATGSGWATTMGAWNTGERSAISIARSLAENDI